jgi:hypothetical protein
MSDMTTALAAKPAARNFLRNMATLLEIVPFIMVVIRHPFNIDNDKQDLLQQSYQTDSIGK